MNSYFLRKRSEYANFQLLVYDYKRSLNSNKGESRDKRIAVCCDIYFLHKDISVISTEIQLTLNRSMKLGHDLHLWIRTCHYIKFIKFKKMVAHEILQNTHTA